MFKRGIALKTSSIGISLLSPVVLFTVLSITYSYKL